MWVKDSVMGSEFEAALRARFARLLHLIQWSSPAVEVRPTFAFGEGLNCEVAQVSVTLGKRDWIGVFRYQRSQGDDGGSWELCSFDPVARVPSTVYSPPVPVVTRLQRSKMILHREPSVLSN